MEREIIPRYALRGQPDAAWLRAIGHSLYGEKWLRPFAKALQVDHSTLYPVVREVDPRPLSSNMRAKVHDFLEYEFQKLIQEHRNRLLLLIDFRDHFNGRPHKDNSEEE